MIRVLHFKFIVLSAVLVLLYMNCSNVRLTGVPQSSVLAKAVNPTGAFCSGLSGSQSFPNKFMFVFDMSLSNLGGAASNGGQGGYRWCTGKDMIEHAGCKTCPEWCYDGVNPGFPGRGPEFVTDGNGQRFQMARDFVLDCGQNNTANKYSFMGFATDSMPGPGVLCRTGYKQANQALPDIDYFATIQTNDDNRGPLVSTTNENPPYTMGNTSYLKGLNCVEQRISFDLDENPTEHSLYQVFFLTDGKPTDTIPGSPPPGQPLNPTVYSQLVTNLKLMIDGQSSTLRLQPVYYGKPTELAAAKLILDGMALEGGTMGTIVASNMADIKNQLCQATSSGPQVANHISKYYAINLTAVYTRGDLRGDSDADGLPDDTEQGLTGWSATNPRSSGALDGLCHRWYGGRQLCQQSVGCAETRKGFRVTKCEEELMGRTLTGGDSDPDPDGLLDGVELMRGTDPLLSDMSIDYDGDEIPNYLEIVRGFDYRDGNPAQNGREVRMSYTQVSPLSQNCAYGEQSYTFSFEQLPLVPVKAYEDTTGDVLNLSHGVNENVVLIAYKVENPLRADKWEIWGAVLRAKIGSSIAANISPSQFVKLAESAGGIQ